MSLRDVNDTTALFTKQNQRCEFGFDSIQKC
jgi:hypothetical protein